MDFKIRAASVKDSKSLCSLFQKYDIDTFGEIQTEEHEIVDLFQTIGNLEKYSWVVEENDQIIGFACITSSENGNFPSLVLIHPEYRHNNIETQLFQQMESTDYKGTLIVSSNTEYEHTIFSNHHFKPIRHWFTMRINVEGVPHSTTFPHGFTMKPFRVNEDADEVHKAFEESFQNHFGFENTSLEEFLKRTKKESFDPNLWFVLREDDEIAGFIFCKRVLDDSGEISNLGIRPKWRKKGLGTKLLHYAFATFQKEGRCNIQLHVDSDNGTNAVSLYESVGMQTIRHFIRFDKVTNL